ncbi:MAG: NnrU family protein [Myxococcales bacterium]|nr:NnrU family protein [Myxococcales bacterium]
MNTPRLASIASLLLALLVPHAPAAAQGKAKGAPPAPPPETELVKRGHKLLRSRGCNACHSDDGTARVGPTLLGLLGRRQKVKTRAGAVREVTVDAAYLQRALRDPEADRALGVSPAIMPPQRLDAAEERAILATITYLSHPAVVARAKRNAPAQGASSLMMLILGVVIFVGGHFALSGRYIRPSLIAKFGEKGFPGIFSLVAAVGLTFVIWGYIRAPYIEIVPPPPWTRWLVNIVMPIAWLFIVLGSAGGPTTAAVSKRGDTDADNADDDVARGIHRVTRHPANFGFFLWGLVHCIANPDVAACILFGGMTLLAGAGMLHIDRRAARDKGEAWTRFAAKTSRLPFAAILAGRNRLVLREIGLLRPLIAIALYVGVLIAHLYIFGASALPF